MYWFAEKAGDDVWKTPPPEVAGPCLEKTSSKELFGSGTMENAPLPKPRVH